MKKILILIAAMALIGCANNSVENQISVTILPLKQIVERITGDDFIVNVLIPPGTSPESYEVTPSAIAQLSKSKYVFTTGLIGFERELTENIETIALYSGIELIGGTCNHGHHEADSHHGHDHSAGADPHIWTSARNLKIVAENIYNALDSKQKYEANYQSLIAELEQLDKEISNIIEDSNIESFYIYHPAFTYFARDYNIEQVCIEQHGKEPSASHLIAIIEQAKSQNTKNVFYQKEFAVTVVETFANEIEANTIEIDPLNEDIIGTLKAFTERLTQ